MLQKVSGKQKEVLAMLVMAVILLVSAWFSDGCYHADEHYQIIEFANYKAGGTPQEHLAWEFREQMRPGFQPFLAYGLLKLATVAGIDDPYLKMMMIRMLTALLVCAVIGWSLRRAGYDPALRNTKKYIPWQYALIWFMPLLLVRFSSENYSGLCMFLSVGYLWMAGEKPRWKDYLFSGIFAGLAFLFRYQSALMIVPLFARLCLINKPGLRNVLIFFFSALVVTGTGFLFDHWLYNDWVFAPWNYFHANLVEDKLSGFGLKPWYYYFTAGSEQAFFPLGLLMWICMIVYWIKNPRSPLSWISLPFLLFHVLTGHKEIRFLFPLLWFIPWILTDVLSFAGRSLRPGLKKTGVILLWILGVCSVLLLLANITKPMDNYLAVSRRISEGEGHYKILYYRGQNPINPCNLHPDFYRVNNVQSLRRDEFFQPVQPGAGSDTVCYYYREGKGMLGQKQEGWRIIKSKLPLWLMNLQAGGWQKRTTTWVLYQMEKNASFPDEQEQVNKN
jgi:phosphatidylinositol glycan class B